MTQANSEDEALLKELQQIKILLQDILIIQGAHAGMKKGEVRSMVGLSSARVTAIWKELNIHE